MMLANAFAILSLAVSVAVGLIFLTSATEKLRHRRLVTGIVANYRLLPDALVSPVALLLPPIEILLGIALVMNLTPVAPVAASLLLDIFAIAMAINIGRGRRDINCGCGRSELGHRLGWGLVMRNLGLGLLLLVPAPASARLASMDIVSALAAGLGLFLAYALFDAIARLAASPIALSRR